MILTFTICSNNYLAQAKVLGDSIRRLNPGFEFLIVLVDKHSPEIDYSYFEPLRIIPIDNFEIEGLDDMILKYNITELNTAVKPFVFDYLFKHQTEVDAIFYFDPDILTYKPLAALVENFGEYDFIVTPHFFTPIYDKCFLREQDILNAGLYNLGFIGIKRSNQASRFLAWWMIKLRDYCYVRVKDGLFVDQLWVNFLPLYHDRVLILRDLGYNVAYWNLHERSLARENGQYVVNDQFPLVFFHFSGYKVSEPGSISKYQNRFSFEQRPDLVSIFEEYHSMVVGNRHDEFAKIKWYYIDLKEALRPKGLKRFIFRSKRMIYRLLKNIGVLAVRNGSGNRS